MPNVGDLAHASVAGWKAKRYVRWDECPQCGAGRWQHRSLSTGRLCSPCASRSRYIVARQVKIERAKQLLDSNKEAVLVGSYGCGHVNQVLRREFGSGLSVPCISDMANVIRSQNVLTHRVCCKCGKEKPIVEFQWSRALQRLCSHCRRERDRAYYRQTRDVRLAGRRRVYHNDPEHIRVRARRDRKVYDAVYKVRVLTHYSSGKLSCVRCGEGDIACLTIDHINGGGHQHRKAVGSHFYHWLIKQGFPEGYQTLCMNCQLRKKHNEAEFNTLEHIERRREYGKENSLS